MTQATHPTQTGGRRAYVLGRALTIPASVILYGSLLVGIQDDLRYLIGGLISAFACMIAGQILIRRSWHYVALRNRADDEPAWIYWLTAGFDLAAASFLFVALPTLGVVGAGVALLLATSVGVSVLARVVITRNVSRRTMLFRAASFAVATFGVLHAAGQMPTGTVAPVASAAAVLALVVLVVEWGIRRLIRSERT